MQGVPVASQPSRRPRVFPADAQEAAIVVATFTALLWAVEFLDRIWGRNLEHDSVHPRHLDGVDGILWAPLLHGTWAHLLANTGPVLVLGFLVLADGVGRWASVTGLIWVISGVGVWLVGTPGFHLGASGLVFGWMTYLLARGFFARSLAQIGFAVVIGIGAGGMLWTGIVPGQPGVSWEGHLFGAGAGIVAAALLATRTTAQPAVTR